MFSVRLTNIAIYLGADHAQVYLLPRFGLRKSRVLSPISRIALEDVVREWVPCAKHIDWFFATDLCRFSSFPSVAAIRNQAEAILVAVAQMERNFGLSSREWVVAVERLWATKSPMICAVRKTDLEFARTFCESLPITCGRIRPWLGCAIQHAPRLRDTEALLIQEPDTISALNKRADEWSILSLRRTEESDRMSHAALVRSLGLAIDECTLASRDEKSPAGLSFENEGFAS